MRIQVFSCWNPIHLNYKVSSHWQVSLIVSSWHKYIHISTCKNLYVYAIKEEKNWHTYTPTHTYTYIHTYNNIYIYTHIHIQWNTYVPLLSVPGDSCPAMADRPWNVLPNTMRSLAGSCHGWNDGTSTSVWTITCVLKHAR